MLIFFEAASEPLSSLSPPAAHWLVSHIHPYLAAETLLGRVCEFSPVIGADWLNMIFRFLFCHITILDFCLLAADPAKVHLWEPCISGQTFLSSLKSNQTILLLFLPLFFYFSFSLCLFLLNSP